MLGGRFLKKHFLSLGQAQGSRSPWVLGGCWGLLPPTSPTLPAAPSRAPPRLRGAAMARMNRPAPVEVSYKNMRFLITHNPTNATLSSFIAVSVQHARPRGRGPPEGHRVRRKAVGPGTALGSGAASLVTGSPGGTRGCPSRRAGMRTAGVSAGPAGACRVGSGSARGTNRGRFRGRRRNGPRLLGTSPVAGAVPSLCWPFGLRAEAERRRREGPPREDWLLQQPGHRWSQGTKASCTASPGQGSPPVGEWWVGSGGGGVLGLEQAGCGLQATDICVRRGWAGVGGGPGRE